MYSRMAASSYFTLRNTPRRIRRTRDQVRSGELRRDLGGDRPPVGVGAGEGVAYLDLSTRIGRGGSCAESEIEAVRPCQRRAAKKQKTNARDQRAIRASHSCPPCDFPLRIFGLPARYFLFEHRTMSSTTLRKILPMPQYGQSGTFNDRAPGSRSDNGGLFSSVSRLHLSLCFVQTLCSATALGV
jgi:hypothetical protein